MAYIDENASPIVMDIGTWQTKAGFGGDDAPRAIFPTIVGRNSQPMRGVMIGMGQRDHWVGDDCFGGRRHLVLSSPIVHGEIANFDNWDRVIHHAYYNELRIAPEEQPLLYVAPSQPPSLQHREKILQNLIETYMVPYFYIAHPAAVAMMTTTLASGVSVESPNYDAWPTSSTGIVVDSGHGITNIVPIVKGHVIQSAMVSQPHINGEQCSERLLQLLTARGYAFEVLQQRVWGKQFSEPNLATMKQSFGFVHHDTKHADDASIAPSPVTALDNKVYELPDGETITLNTERWQCVDIMFRQPYHMIETSSSSSSAPPAISSSPSTLPSIRDSLPMGVFRAMMSCETWYGGNIILSGGNTMWKGFAERLQHEVQTLVDQHIAQTSSSLPSSSSSSMVSHGRSLMDAAKQSMRVKVHAPADRQNLSWLGGSILSSLSTFRSLCISKEEYDEYGPSIVRFKCPL